MKLTRAVLAMVASLAFLVPFSTCRPVLDVGGLRETIYELETALTEGRDVEPTKADPNPRPDLPIHTIGGVVVKDYN